MTPAEPQHAKGTRLVRLDVALRLLDHQIVGPEGELLGNVDDIELLETAAGLLVTGIAVGPGALAQRLPGRVGDWLYAIWHRLHPASDPRPIVVPVEHITRLGSAVEVDEHAAEALAEAFGLEMWLRTYVIARIPGAKGGGDQRAGSGPAPHDATPARGKGSAYEGPSSDEGRTVGEDWQPRPNARFLSTLLGRPVVDGSDHEMGRVCELYCQARPLDGPQSPMRVTHLEYGRHQRGSELGYTSDPEQGPWVLAQILRGWQRHNRVVPVTSIERLSDPEGPLVVRDTSSLPHPHAFRAQ